MNGRENSEAIMSEVKETDKIIEEVESTAEEQSPANDMGDSQPDQVVEVLEGEIVAEDEENTDSEAAGQSGEDEATDGEEELSPEALLVEQLQAELAAVRAEAAAQTDKVQRIAAEFQNSKKRQADHFAKDSGRWVAIWSAHGDLRGPKEGPRFFQEHQKGGQESPQTLPGPSSAPKRRCREHLGFSYRKTKVFEVTRVDLEGQNRAEMFARQEKQ